jgi:hypothetical protein
VLSLIVHTEGDPLEKASWIASGLGFRLCP